MNRPTPCLNQNSTRGTVNMGHQEKLWRESWELVSRVLNIGPPDDEEFARLYDAWRLLGYPPTLPFILTYSVHGKAKSRIERQPKKERRRT